MLVRESMMNRTTFNLYGLLIIIIEMLAVFFVVGSIENRYYEAIVIFLILLIGNLFIQLSVKGNDRR